MQSILLVHNAILTQFIEKVVRVTARFFVADGLQSLFKIKLSVTSSWSIFCASLSLRSLVFFEICSFSSALTTFFRKRIPSIVIYWIAIWRLGSHLSYLMILGVPVLSSKYPPSDMTGVNCSSTWDIASTNFSINCSILCHWN